MSTRPVLAANMATIVVESFLYGVFVVLSIISAFFLIRRTRQSIGCSPRLAGSYKIILRQPLLIVTACLLLSNTGHWALGIVRSYKAFVFLDGQSQSVTYLLDLRRPSEVARIALLMLSLIVTDAAVIYRLWIVWAHSRRVVLLPLCTFVGLIICAGGLVYQFTVYQSGEDAFNVAWERWITANFVFTISTNVYCTAMIAWRVWKVHAETREYIGSGGDSIIRGLIVFVESAALYTVWTVTYCIVYEVHSAAQNTMNNAFPFMAGIAFMLINVRIGMGITEEHPERPSQVSIGMVIAPNLEVSMTATKELHAMRLSQAYGQKSSTVSSESCETDGSGLQDSPV